MYGRNTRGLITSQTISNQGTTSFRHDANGNTTSMTDPLGRTMTVAYNARNQETARHINPTFVTSYDAAGNVARRTDGLGFTTFFSYDAQDRLIAQALPDPDGAGPLSAPLTQWQYNLAGQLSAIIDPVGNQTSYQHDDAGRMVRETDALGNFRQFVYNAADELTAATDRSGRTRTFTYNAHGLRSSETWLDPQQQAVRTINWVYDQAAQLVSASDPDSSYAFNYDVAGQVTRVDNTGTTGVPQVTLNFAYGFLGNRTSLSDNLGASIDYDYLDNRLAYLSMNTGSATSQVGLTYDTNGRLTGLDRTVGARIASVRTAYAYDNLDRLTNLTHTRWVGTESTTLSQFQYTFNNASQVTSYTGPEGTLNYTYDQTGQLIGVTGARSEGYAYDANGNRALTGYVTGPANRLLTDGVYNYAYDAEGNMLVKVRIADGQRTENTWDHRNRLTRVLVKDAAGVVLHEEGYTYDVFDRRIGVWVDSDGAGAQDPKQRWTVYDGDNPYADFDAEGSLTNRYLYGPAIDQLFARISEAGDLDWYLGDILGSVRQIVNAEGTILDEIDYNSFGQILNETNPSAGDRFKFTAREWDEVGQYFYRARYYGPDVGRFTSEDPIRFAAGDSNLYRYVGNGPTNWIDPSGRTKGGKQHKVPSDLTGKETPEQVQALIDKLLKDSPKESAKHIRCLKTWHKIITRRGGPVGIAITVVLAAPEIAQAGQEGGVEGAAGAAGNIAVHTVVGIGSSTFVGLGVAGTAGGLGTSVTVGGAAVTTVAGATGVGAAVIVTAVGGYEVGNAIGQIEVGGQSVHDHIADGIIWGLGQLGLW